MQSNSCIFCDDEAVEWPVYADEYIKSYSLCKHHLGVVLSQSTIKKYCEEKLEAIKEWEALTLKLHSFMRNYDEAVFDKVIAGAPLQESPSNKSKESIFRAIDAHCYDCKPDIGEPLSISINNDIAEEAIAKRIVALAKRVDAGMSVDRCKYYTKAGDRCAYYTEDNKDYCDLHYVKAESLNIGTPKMVKLLEILRSK